MPAFDKKFDDHEVAKLANYIRNAWDTHASLTGAAESKVGKGVEHGGG